MAGDLILWILLSIPLMILVCLVEDIRNEQNRNALPGTWRKK